MMPGQDVHRVLTINDLAYGDILFAATGVTSGDMLKGVRFESGGVCETHSIVMRAKTGTVRFVEARHNLGRKDPSIR
jgi:fructose-1,6-bisphosphatase II